MPIKWIILLLMLMACTGCNKVDYDPTTSVLKWVIKQQKEDKNEKK